MSKVDHRNIEKETINNKLYRKVIYTIPDKIQLVLMSLKVGETIPREVHPNVVQFIRVESGDGEAIIGRTRYKLRDGDSIIIPNGKYHTIINTSKTKELKLYTIYSPPEHPPNRRNIRQPKEK